MATRERVQEQRERNRESEKEGENMRDREKERARRERERERGAGAWMRKLCPDDIPESSLMKSLRSRTSLTSRETKELHRFNDYHHLAGKSRTNR